MSTEKLEKVMVKVRARGLGVEQELLVEEGASVEMSINGELSTEEEEGGEE